VTDYLGRLAHAPATRPALTVYVAAVVDAWAVVEGVLAVDLGLILLGVVTGLVIMCSLHHEVTAVHKLVNSQHDALTARVDQLLATLAAAGVQAPHEDAARTPRRSGGSA
jgi:CHASE1-domain containing sensor protein